MSSFQSQHLTSNSRRHSYNSRHHHRTFKTSNRNESSSSIETVTLRVHKRKQQHSSMSKKLTVANVLLLCLVMVWMVFQQRLISNFRQSVTRTSSNSLALDGFFYSDKYDNMTAVFSMELKPMQVRLGNTVDGGFMTNSSSISNQKSVQLVSIYDSEEVRDMFLDDNSLQNVTNEDECISMHSWHDNLFPTCNLVHEISGLLEDDDQQSELLSVRGSMRTVWRLADLERQSYVLKIIHLHLLGIEEETFMERHRKDAVAMEVLTSNPSVMDIYGHCAHSALNEIAFGEVDVLLKDESLSPNERLKIARELVVALHEIHHVSDVAKVHKNNTVSLVHNDLNPSNLVISSTGRIKFNDFNLAEFVKQNVTSNDECGFLVRTSNPLWRSPEEIMNTTLFPASSKVDIYGMCNILYQVFTKHTPYKW